jgi:hypothetical protein
MVAGVSDARDLGGDRAEWEVEGSVAEELGEEEPAA